MSYMFLALHQKNKPQTAIQDADNLENDCESEIC